MINANRTTNDTIKQARTLFASIRTKINSGDTVSLLIYNSVVPFFLSNMHPFGVFVLVKWQIVVVIAVSFPVLKHGSLRWLPQTSILIRAHFQTNTLQNFLNAHVAIPIAHGGYLGSIYNSRPLIHTSHINTWHETNFGRNGRILFGAMNSQLIKSTVMLCLTWKQKVTTK
jgi:hypothetical protein